MIPGRAAMRLQACVEVGPEVIECSIEGFGAKVAVWRCACCDAWYASLDREDGGELPELGPMGSAPEALRAAADQLASAAAVLADRGAPVVRLAKIAALASLVDEAATRVRDGVISIPEVARA